MLYINHPTESCAWHQVSSLLSSPVAGPHTPALCDSCRPVYDELCPVVPRPTLYCHASAAAAATNDRSAATGPTSVGTFAQPDQAT